MAGSVNKVILIGHLGNDPKVRTKPNGEKIASFSMATSKRWREKDGEQKQRTQWHNVAVLGSALSGIVEQYLRKGHAVYVEGEIASRAYQDRDGIDKVAFEIVVPPFGGSITLLERRARDDAPDADDEDSYGSESPKLPDADFSDEAPF
jgi:single-strand DNA-binding protein